MHQILDESTVCVNHLNCIMVL